MNMVRVYKNLNKKCLSILHKTKKGWRLKEHRKSIKLKNVEFKVYEAGRQRVLKNKIKNVHAYIEGTPIKRIPRTLHTLVKYNPYKYSSFVIYITTSNYVTAIKNAKYCMIGEKILC